MDTENITELASDLNTSISDLETALAPLLDSPLSAAATRLPLLDKAKLYVLATYSIESILFSSLRLNGVDAKVHPIFKELARVREYFNKIKTAENPHDGRGRLDKDAAGRIIKHGLAGNDRYDQDRAEHGAKRKLEDIASGEHTKFDEEAKRLKVQEESITVVKADDIQDDHGHGVRATRDEGDRVDIKKDKKHKRKGRKHHKPSSGECYGALLD